MPCSRRRPRYRIAFRLNRKLPGSASDAIHLIRIEAMPTRLAALQAEPTAALLRQSTRQAIQPALVMLVWTAMHSTQAVGFRLRKTLGMTRQAVLSLVILPDHHVLAPI